MTRTGSPSGGSTGATTFGAGGGSTLAMVLGGFDGGVVLGVGRDGGGATEVDLGAGVGAGSACATVGVGSCVGVLVAIGSWTWTVSEAVSGGTNGISTVCLRKARNQTRRIPTTRSPPPAMAIQTLRRDEVASSSNALVSSRTGRDVEVRLATGRPEGRAAAAEVVVVGARGFERPDWANQSSAEIRSLEAAARATAGGAGVGGATDGGAACGSEASASGAGGRSYQAEAAASRWSGSCHGSSGVRTPDLVCGLGGCFATVGAGGAKAGLGAADRGGVGAAGCSNHADARAAARAASSGLTMAVRVVVGVGAWAGDAAGAGLC